LGNGESFDIFGLNTPGSGLWTALSQVCLAKTGMSLGMSVQGLSQAAPLRQSRTAIEIVR